MSIFTSTLDAPSLTRLNMGAYMSCYSRHIVHTLASIYFIFVFIFLLC